MASSSSWHPPCSGRYGRMGEPHPIVCERPPDHKGHHQSREAGVRWDYPGHRLPRCPWRSCTAPDLVVDDDDCVRHLCPDGEAARRYPEDE